MLEKLFSSKGRVTRLQNIGYELLMVLIMMILGMIIATIVLSINYFFGAYDNLLNSGASTITPPAGIELILISIPIILAMYSNMIIKIKRLHDINLSGWWFPIFLLLCLPYIALYFWPGTKGKNRFDEDYNSQKGKHSSLNKNTSIPNNFEINEDEIYEKIMMEIEKDKKIKSTWAKALSQSDGERDKAESFYIKSRFDNIKNKIYKNIESPCLQEINKIEEKKAYKKEKINLINIIKKFILGEYYITKVISISILSFLILSLINYIIFEVFTNDVLLTIANTVYFLSIIFFIVALLFSVSNYYFLSSWIRGIFIIILTMLIIKMIFILIESVYQVNNLLIH